MNLRKPRSYVLIAVLGLASCDSGDPTFNIGPPNDGVNPPVIDDRDVENNDGDGTPDDTEPTDSGETSSPEVNEPPEENSGPDVVDNPGNEQTPGTELIPEEDASTVFTPSDSDIRDNLALYDQDGYTQSDVIRVDLKTNTTAGVCIEEDLSGCTLADVLSDTDSNDEFKVDIAVHFSATDFADDGSVNNAELRQRGGGARYAPQKSFRIKLDDKDQLWRGERHLQLNKHPFENSRIRNKLSFDLLTDIPHLPSFRTQFVNLWIDDGSGAVDYGFYTHVERADERYLKRRNLNDDDRLYKAEFFRFRESDLKTLLIDEDGKPLEKDVFESVLEIENGKNHGNLIAMLDAFLDLDQSFQSVFDRYFNDNNVLTWIAVNLLLGQQDATRHNYFLYNPEDSEKFYFLPWDYDFTFQEHIEPANDFTPDALRSRLAYGYAQGTENKFINSYYRMPGAHERILAAAAEIRENYLTDARITEHAALLATASYPFVSAQPDIEFNPYYSERSSSDFASKVASNHSAMINNFSIPLPPTMEEPQLLDGSWRLSWIPALEVTGQTLTYDLQVATQPTFLPDEIEFQAAGIENSDGLVKYDIDSAVLSSNSSLYVRLIARSVSQPERYWQIADNYLDISNVRYYGIVELVQKL